MSAVTGDKLNNASFKGQSIVSITQLISA
jgi:hypothetical protein